MNFKEKNKHLRDLLAPQHVLKDLALLKQLDPRNDQLATFGHAPARHAERILYVLLDIATPEQIRNNRRAPQTTQNSELGTQELVNQVSDLDEKVEELETRNAELEMELEEAVEDLESELEAEKKSELPSKPIPVVPKSSKKKTSSHESTGRSSKTKTSK